MTTRNRSGRSSAANTNEAITNEATAMAATLSDESRIGRPVRSYGFARRKVWPFAAMLVAMMLFGLAGVAHFGLAGQWGMIFLLIVLPAAALAILFSELRIQGPVLLIGEAGLHDRRKGSPPLRWSEIQEATLRNRLVGKGIRILSTSGERYDIDLSLVDAEPAAVIRLIQELAGRQAATAHG